MLYALSVPIIAIILIPTSDLSASTKITDNRQKQAERNLPLGFFDALIAILFANGRGLGLDPMVRARCTDAHHDLDGLQRGRSGSRF